MENPPDRNINKSYKRGFWIGTIAGIIVIGVAMNFSEIYNFVNKSKIQTRYYDSRTKANLHNIFLACHAYWDEKGSENNCTAVIASQREYGYIQSANVNISGSGTETEFSGIAQHIGSTKTFSIDSNGHITERD